MRISLASVPPATGVGEAIRFFAGEGSVGNVMTWWEDVDGSEKGQRDVFYALCASYALVSLVALVCIPPPFPEFWTLKIHELA